MDIQRKSPLIAIVDDDESVRNAVHGVLKSVGMRAQMFASAEEFLNSGQQEATGCLITDIQMPKMTGFELLVRLTQSDNRIPVIVITGHGTAKMRKQAMKAGVIAFLEKPFDDEVLLENVRVALQN
jgi:two-component system response regulator FixJ